MGNPLSIAEGHINLARKKLGVANEDVEQLAVLRLAHCRLCKINGNPGLVDGRCIVCRCKMEAKTRVLTAKCPVGKW